MSKVDITKDNVWDYFKRISEEKFQAKCRKCGDSFIYINDSTFLTHLRSSKHKIYFIDEANKNLEKTKQDIYYNSTFIKCDICEKHVLQEDFDDHIQSHPVEEVAYYEASRTKEEHMKQIDSFDAKCKLKNCNTFIRLQIASTLLHHLLSKHKNELENMQTGAIDDATNVTNKEELLHNYTLHRPHYFRAKCKFCNNFQGYYVDTKKFHQHLEKHHNEATLYEKKNKRFPWKLFKYYDEKKLQCFLCENLHTEPFLEDSLLQHIFTYHEEMYNSCYYDHNDSDWAWKYCDISGDFQVLCQICSEKTDLDIQLTNLQHHINNTHLNKSPSGKEEYKIAGESQSQKEKSREKGLSKGE
ncbi:uncharacterized protein [Linepithema humile]|uniref:uncharacterized protein n=1 Tax=Linepithema humile TaxID=83485 RepID=UPI00351E7E4C